MGALSNVLEVKYADGEYRANFVNRLLATTAANSYLKPMLGIGVYGTPVVDNALIDNIQFTVNVSAGVNKTEHDVSCMAGMFICSNTSAAAATGHTKLQALLCSTTVKYSCFDAYAVQGHVSVTGDASAVGEDTNIGNICGGSFKASVSTGKTATATVSGVLVTLDGAGTVTGTHSGIWIDATVSCDNGILLSSTGTVDYGLRMTGTVTNAFSWAATGSCIGTTELVDNASSDVNCDAHIVCDVGGTPYYIPLFNTKK
jgi:hypothetical protein